MVASFSLADYRVAPVELVEEHPRVRPFRPVLDLHNLLQPWHMKSYANCDSVKVTSLFKCPDFLLALLPRQYHSPHFRLCETCCFQSSVFWSDIII